MSNSILTNRYVTGGALLVCPVTDPGVTEVKVLLPGSDELWYDTNTAAVHNAAITLDLPVTLDTVPVFQRGGTVVPRRAGCGSSTADLQQHPITLTVALDSKGNADGFLYLDDGHSFSYRDQMQFCLRRFTMRAGRLVNSCADDQGLFVSDDKVESVVILGLNSLKRKPKLRPSMKRPKVSVCGAPKTTVTFEFDAKRDVLTLTGLDLEIHKDWEIEI